MNSLKKLKSKFCPRWRLRILTLFQGLIAQALWILSVHFLPNQGWAAPFPGMGSSKLTANGAIVQIPQKKFQISAGKTKWEVIPMEQDLDHLNKKLDKDKNKKDKEVEEVAFRFEDAKSKATLSLKTETLKQNISLENYSRRWIKEYSAFGFDLLGTRPFAQNRTKGLVIDLIHKKLNQQSRQVIFLRNKVSVILTCTQEANTFQQALTDCNEIVRTFRWN